MEEGNNEMDQMRTKLQKARAQAADAKQRLHRALTSAAAAASPSSQTQSPNSTSLSAETKEALVALMTQELEAQVSLTLRILGSLCLRRPRQHGRNKRDGKETNTYSMCIYTFT
jgi:hypothetical protein